MNNLTQQLIAPCGMNCGICSGYLAYKHNIPRRVVYHCEGCRPRDKQCSFLKKKCVDDLKLLKGEVEYCFECDSFPCESLAKLDKKYREGYAMSQIDNLMEIKSKGIDSFIESQEEKYACPNCGNLISIHNGKCFVCQKVKSWKS